MFWHHSREGRTGWRAWWHFNDRSCFHTEVNWWTHFCHLNVEVTDEGWKFSIAVPPVAIWLCLDGFGLWQPKRKHVFTWDNNREVWLTDRREFNLAVHDWTIRFVPWGRWGEWVTADPWWIRGVSFNLPDVLLGRHRYARETVRRDMQVPIPMPEGCYWGTASFERATWKRPRWFRMTRLSTKVDVAKGVPFAGKGENSWDCGDDGLFGYSVEGHDLDKASAHGVEVVLSQRRKNGMPSQQAITEALG